MRESTEQFGMDGQEEWRRKNKTLGKERCINIVTLYINK